MNFLNFHVSTKIKFQRHLESISHQLVCKQIGRIGASFEVKYEMHGFLRLLTILLELINHDPISIGFVCKSDTVNADFFGQTLDYDVCGLEEASILDEYQIELLPNLSSVGCARRKIRVIWTCENVELPLIVEVHPK